VLFLGLRLHFLSREKKMPVPRLTLHVVAAAGARGNSPALQRAQTIRALFSIHIADARRGAKGNKKP
jgi:hypothetical protein